MKDIVITYFWGALLTALGILALLGIGVIVGRRLKQQSLPVEDEGKAASEETTVIEAILHGIGPDDEFTGEGFRSGPRQIFLLIERPGGISKQEHLYVPWDTCVPMELIGKRIEIRETGGVVTITDAKG